MTALNRPTKYRREESTGGNNSFGKTGRKWL